MIFPRIVPIQEMNKIKQGTQGKKPRIVRIVNVTSVRPRGCGCGGNKWKTT